LNIHGCPLFTTFLQGTDDPSSDFLDHQVATTSNFLQKVHLPMTDAAPVVEGDDDKSKTYFCFWIFRIEATSNISPAPPTSFLSISSAKGLENIPSPELTHVPRSWFAILGIVMIAVSVSILDLSFFVTALFVLTGFCALYLLSNFLADTRQEVMLPSSSLCFIYLTPHPPPTHLIVILGL
jgi:hypothetical protein